MEGFGTERTGGTGSPDPGQAAREAADRIAAQVRDILGQAEERAGEIRSQAEADADVIRKNAAGAAARLLERVDELEREMEGHFTYFFATIRHEVEGLSTPEEIQTARAGRAAIERETVEFRQTSALEPRLDPTRPQEPQAGPFPQVEPEPPTAEPEPAPAEAEAEAEPEPAAAEPEPPPKAPEEPRRRRGILRRRRDEDEDATSREGAAEDAHVMALNMALNGTPREETEEYLVRRFGQVDDLESILDDVYGRVKRR
jgi:hypothetical protein